MGLVWGFFCMPEMAKKSLEEIDEMFAAGVPAWKSRRELKLGLSFGCDRTLTRTLDWRGDQAAKITDIENHGVSSDTESETSVEKPDLEPIVEEKPVKA